MKAPSRHPSLSRKHHVSPAHEHYTRFAPPRCRVPHASVRSILQRLLFWQRYANTAATPVSVASDADTDPHAHAAVDQCTESPAGDLGGPVSGEFDSCGAPDEDGKDKDKAKDNRSWLFSMEMNAQVR